MSLKPKPPHPLGTCPECAEPLESGDKFCGACGYDLSAAELPDRPTVPIALPVDWPPAPPRDPNSLTTATQHPGELAGTDSGGRDLPTMPVRTDGVLEEAPAGVPAPAAPAMPAGTPGAAGAAAQAGPAGAAAPTSSAGSADPASSARPAGPAGSAAPAEPGAPATPAGAAAPTSSAGSADPASSARAAGPGASPTPAGPAAPSGATGERGDGDFTLPAPDPRAALVAGAAAATTGDDRKVCVACRSGRVDGDGYCEHCGHAQPRDRDHMEEELPAVAAVSDRGLRHHRNEDSFAVASAALPGGAPAALAVVCDGVSSATRPDEASAAAATAARTTLLAALPQGTHPQQAMQEAIVAAADAVTALAERPAGGEREHQNSPACTIVSAIVADGLLTVGWVGDSRAYWVPDDRGTPPARLTEDDSWAAQMVAAGLMNEAQAYADERAHAITGWLGADSYELEPHTAAFKPDRPGVVVVCTDGLWNYAEGAEDMARIMPPDAAERPLHAAQVLVGHALDGGGHDNITVALLPFALPAPSAP